MSFFFVNDIMSYINNINNDIINKTISDIRFF